MTSGFLSLIHIFAGSLALDVQIALPMVLIGAAAGCLVGFVLEFFLFGADSVSYTHLYRDSRKSGERRCAWNRPVPRSDE